MTFSKEKMNSTLRPLAITIGFCVLILVLSPAYWYLGVLNSWGGGPEDDIFIVYLLVLPILIHGFFVGRYGYRSAVISTLLFFAMVAFLCVARHFEIDDRTGYSEWHARRSLESLLWSIPWFLGSISFVILRKIRNKENKAEEPTPNPPSD